MTSPEELLELALTMVRDATNEPQRRAAVSRLYYAVFHSVRRHLQVRLDGAHVHEQLIDAMKRSGERTQVVAANRLNSLRLARRHADYSLNEPFSAVLMQTAMQHAMAVRKSLGFVAAASPPPLDRASNEPPG